MGLFPRRRKRKGSARSGLNRLAGLSPALVVRAIALLRRIVSTFVTSITSMRRFVAIVL